MLNDDNDDRRDRLWLRAETVLDLIVAAVGVAAAFVWILVF